MNHNIEPREVFDIFAQINEVPRPSKHEQKISAWLQQFARDHHIECEVDNAMNVVMRIPATAGYESHPGVILQAHQDMVCEKDADVKIDFMTDPIQTSVDGDWLHAHGTTLGGDDGIGMAMALAALISPTLKHPQLEALFTVDEETGLTGANRLQDGLLRGKRLINLDNEDDGQICIGCAGGIDTLGKMHYTPVPLPADTQWFALSIKVSGLLGGHSGEDINKGRATATKTLAFILENINAATRMLVVSINAGNLRNAIAREGEAIIVVPMQDKEDVRALFNIISADFHDTFGDVETHAELTMQSTELPALTLSARDSFRLISALTVAPHGMVKMCRDIPNLVETSTNLSSVKMKDGYIEINTSQRSSIESEKHRIKDQVEYALSICCDEVTHGDGYPGWAPNTHSQLLDVIVATHKDLFGSDPKVLAIHAGLECGLFLTKYPDFDMVAIGPQMYDVHSPKERLSISSTAKTWKWLQATIERL